MDLLATLPQDVAWSLLAWVRSRRILTRQQLTWHLLRRTGRRGTPQLRFLHSCTATGASSPAEKKSHTILRANHVTGWEAGARIIHNGMIIAEADLLFKKQKLIIEIDGYNSHSNKSDFVTDRRRQNRLVNAGYTILRYTWDDLMQAPHIFISQIRETLTKLDTARYATQFPGLPPPTG